MDPRELPALREWINKIGVWDLRQFMVNNVPVSQVVAVGLALWPKFRKVDDCIFVDFLYDEETYTTWKDKSSDGRAVERAINHLHLWDLFAADDSAEYDALVEIAGLMAETWKVAASVKFPSLLVNVDVVNGDDDYGPTLILYSSPPSR